MSTPETPSPAPLSAVEIIKSKSRHLRGSLVESLADPVTGAIADDDTQLIKFHGSYQQDDRDIREERRAQKLEPAYSFMIRTRLPGGVCTPQQWLALDAIARTYANGTLRLTTRQAFQVHGVIKRHLKTTIAAMNARLIDTIAACGDVNRNVLANANPVETQLHAEVYDWAVKLSEHLLPKTRAYHEIWLDGEKVAGSIEVEPIYGDTYLPRKFKAAIAVPPYNDVDVYAHDLGFIAIIENGALSGFNVTVGGGMGATHGDAATFPRLADLIGFISPEQLLHVAETVVKVQRDFGDRTLRKHARLKYTIEDRGIEWFRSELEQRLGFALAPARDFEFVHSGDRFGWVQGHDGRWHLTLRIEAGRIADKPGQAWLTGLNAIAQIHHGDFRLTANQNLIIAGIAENERNNIEALLAEHGLDGYRQATPLRLNALACVALPTCALAMAEAERYLPELVTKLEAQLDTHGLREADIRLRITGCPNGCARPYLAEIGLVGKAPGRYNLMLGADARGQRLNQMYRENIDENEILNVLDPLFARYAGERENVEGFGDFLLRAGVIAAPRPALRIAVEITTT
ncbi:assimilatory sulfite reductase (NADPH) hemoprotein subunit [Pseudolysobacter antarcticus]|uniref:Sulfite reductase [NADPH] hemoprotein beta-component n=1 Tax=Pseudolysobacter antarcticus TaxID=2511995 RepID=A0A411HHY0_9GAMM|nr:assimilatory sulfite reductase (NADPH) hemoprotein subunit [Pseudolysobacter antarcticus]QBB70014.1 assimilatory sulfite reductase (NADPH) hemoprotein subunit [Pseudolysobacter antarcticus]